MAGIQLVSDAIAYAARMHRTQKRRGEGTPYIWHPLRVGMMLQWMGCAPEVVAAGILHDTLEDTDATTEDLQTLFGDCVTDLVAACTEPEKSVPWEDRKQHMIDCSRNAPLEVKLIKAADKLDNLRETRMALTRAANPDDVWKRFNRGREEQEWYYREVVKAICEGVDFASPQGHLFADLLTALDSVFSGT